MALLYTGSDNGSPRVPRKGDNYTVESVTYDTSGAPFLLFQLDRNGNLCVPYPGLTTAQYNQAKRNLEGKTIELGRDPVSQYNEGNISCHVLPQSMIKLK